MKRTKFNHEHVARPYHTESVTNISPPKVAVTHTHTHTHTHTNLHLHIYIDRETNGHNDLKEEEEAYTPLDDEKEEGIHTTRQTNTPLNKPTH